MHPIRATHKRSLPRHHGGCQDTVCLAKDAPAVVENLAGVGVLALDARVEVRELAPGHLGPVLVPQVPPGVAADGHHAHVKPDHQVSEEHPAVDDRLVHLRARVASPSHPGILAAFDQQQARETASVQTPTPKYECFSITQLAPPRSGPSHASREVTGLHTNAQTEMSQAPRGKSTGAVRG